MIRRTTVEIDDQLLDRAKKALGASTTRAAIEQALRHAAEAAEDAKADRAARQRSYLGKLTNWVDVDVLASEQMWR